MGPACVPAAKGRLNGGGVPAAKPCLSNACKTITITYIIWTRESCRYGQTLTSE
jgi:hypothetical protein